MAPLYKKLNVLKLEDLYKYNLGVLCHNVVHLTSCPDRIAQLFVLRNDVIKRETRASIYDFYIAKTKNISSQKRPSYAGAVFWNSLPDNIKSISSPTEFKSELKSLLLNMY